MRKWRRVIIQLSSPTFSFCHTLWKRDINFSSEEGLLSGPVQESVCSCTCALGYEENVRLNHSCGTPWIYIHWIFERIWEEVQGESQCVCACVCVRYLVTWVLVLKSSALIDCSTSTQPIYCSKDKDDKTFTKCTYCAIPPTTIQSTECSWVLPSCLVSRLLTWQHICSACG